MCILFSTAQFEAEDTLLIVAPVSTPPTEHQAWQLTYINSLTPKKGILKTPLSKPPLMIVPVPNPHNMHEDDFTLFKVDNDTGALLRGRVEQLSSSYETEASSDHEVTPRGMKSRSVPSSRALRVQKVGSYRISVAPSLHDLCTRAPWNRYSIQKRIVNRILRDIQKRYAGTSTAFIIAEGSSKSGVSSAGFAVRYRSDEEYSAFFPTSHEPPTSPFHAAGTGQGSLVQLDVTLVALGAILLPSSLLSSHQINMISAYDPPMEDPPQTGILLRADDKKFGGQSKWMALEEILEALPTKGEGEVHGNTVVQHDAVHLASLWKLNGKYANKDVIARKATTEDIEVTARLYTDLQSWYHHRKIRSSLSAFPSLKQLRMIDYVLQALAKRLSRCRTMAGEQECASIGRDETPVSDVSYVNLDIPNVSLDETSYADKDGAARFVRLLGHQTPVDTVGTIYIRVSSRLGACETLTQRIVRDRTLGGNFESTKAPSSRLPPFWTKR